MEDWQITYITECKPRLILLRSCNASLVSYLGSFRVLSIEEMENLGKLLQNDGNVKASDLLYDILLTRTKGYEIMTKALYKCKQSGALAIFLEGFQKQQIENPFELCDIQLEPSTYFDKVVTWQLVEEKLGNIVKSVDDAKLGAIFKENLSGAEYLLLNDEKKVFQLFENTVPAPLPYYLERYIIQRKYLDEKIFECECSDIFVIKGLEKSHLSQLAGLEMTCSSTSFRKNVRFVHLERDKDFTSISKVTNVPTHLVRCQNGKFELLKSSGGLETVHKFLKPDPMTIHEETFISDQVLDTEENICIADSPGMGKSIFLARIANKCISVGENIAIYLKLEILLQSVKSKSNEEINFVELWTYVISHAAKTKFALALLQELIINTDLRLYLFLDGFDEIRPSHRELATNVLKCLVNNSKFKNMQILVTTRLHLQSDVELLIGSRAYEIAPIDSWDQLKLILKYWETQGYTKTKKAEKLAEKYLSSITKTAGGFEKDVTSSPMICTMLAELYQHEAEKIYFKYAVQVKETEPKKRDAILNFTDFFNKPFFYVGSTITELYNKILHMKFVKSGSSISNVNKSSQSSIKMLALNSSVYNAHVAAAIELLFPDWKEKLERHFQNPGVLDTDELLRIGIVEPKGFNKPLGFVHRSFAEYLIADFILSKNFSCPENEDIVYFLFSRVLSTFEYSEQLLKYPYFDRQLTTVKSFIFLYPTIVNFLNGLMENEFYYTQCTELVTWAMVPEAYKNTNLLHEMLSACIFPGHLNLISFIKDSFLSGDTTLFTIQMNESDISWENLVYIAAKYGTEVMLEKCYEIYNTFNVDHSPTIFKWVFDEKSRMPTPYTFVPLHVAVERGNYHIFEFVVKTNLKRGQNIQDYKCLLHICVNNSSNHLLEQRKEKCEIIDYLIRFPVDFLNEQEPTTGRTPLLMDNIDYYILIHLLEKGADVSVKNMFSESIAHSACKYLSAKTYFKLLTNEKVFRHLNNLLDTETRTVNLTGTYSDILRMNVMAIMEENKILILFQVDITQNKDHTSYNVEYRSGHWERKLEILRQIEHIGKRITFEEDKASHFNFLTCRDGAAFLIDNTLDTQEEFTDHVTVKPVSNVMKRIFDSIFKQLLQNAQNIDLGEIISMWEEKCAYVSSQGLCLTRKHRSISERDLEMLDFYGSNFKTSLESFQTDKEKLQQKQDTGVKQTLLTPFGYPKYLSSKREARGVPSSTSSSSWNSSLSSSRKQVQKEEKIALLEMPKADYSRKVEDPDNVVYQGKYFVLTSPICSRVRGWMRSFLGSTLVQKLSGHKQHAYFTLISILLVVLISRVLWVVHEGIK